MDWAMGGPSRKYGCSMVKSGLYFVVRGRKIIQVTRPCQVNFCYPQVPGSFWVWDRHVLSVLRLGCWVASVVLVG
jgi:hypothetical protein